MKYEKWDEVLAPYEHAVEELKVKFKNIRKEFLTKGEYSPIEFVTGRTKKISSIISKEIIDKINSLFQAIILVVGNVVNSDSINSSIVTNFMKHLCKITKYFITWEIQTMIT